MSIFDDNFYSKAVSKNYTDMQIVEGARNHLKFQFGSVGYKAFCHNYSNEYWLGRKVAALPMAAWSLLIQTTYHLAKTVFVGIPKLCMRDAKPIQVQLFSFVRDLQEGVGRLLTIFHDCFGTYMVQEAQFHKTYYECATGNYTAFIKKNILNGPYSSVEYKLASLNPHEFRQIWPSLNSAHYPYIPDFHINALDYPRLTSDQVNTIFSYRTTDRFLALSPSNLNFILENFDTSSIIRMIPVSSLNQIDFASLTRNALWKMFPASSNEEAVRAKFAKLSGRNLAVVLKKINDPRYYSYVPLSAYSTFDFKNLGIFYLRHMFPLVSVFSSIEKNNTRAKLQELPVESFTLVFSQLSFYEREYFSVVPNKHLNALNYDEMTLGQVNQLLTSVGADYFKVTMISSDNLCKIFHLLPDTIKTRIVFSQYSGHPRLEKLYNDFLSGKSAEKEDFQDPHTDWGFFNSYYNFKPKSWSHDIPPFGNARSRTGSSSRTPPFGGIPRSHTFSTFPDQSQEHYKILGLKNGASLEDVRNAYKKLSLKHHPDRIKQQPNESDEAYKIRQDKNMEEFKKINRAHEFLVNKL